MKAIDRHAMQKTYYRPTSDILKEAFEIGCLLGQVKQQTRHNGRAPRTEAIHLQAILQLEGSSMSAEQIEAIQHNGKVIGPAQDIAKVERSIEVYRRAKELDIYSEADLKAAHALLIDAKASGYRTTAPEQSSATAKYAIPTLPPAERVAWQMQELFEYLRDGEDHIVIKSCVFHFELICIQPFRTANERMGRLWQSMILQHYDPVFERVSLPAEIERREGDYYAALHESACDGLCTPFIRFWLPTLRKALQAHLRDRKAAVPQDFARRLTEFKEVLKSDTFSKSDYAVHLDELPIATVTQDLERGQQLGYIEQQGDGKYGFL